MTGSGYQKKQGVAFTVRDSNAFCSDLALCANRNYIVDHLEKGRVLSNYGMKDDCVSDKMFREH